MLQREFKKQGKSTCVSVVFEGGNWKRRGILCFSFQPELQGTLVQSGNVKPCSLQILSGNRKAEDEISPESRVGPKISCTLPDPAVIIIERLLDFILSPARKLFSSFLNHKRKINQPQEHEIPLKFSHRDVDFLCFLCVKFILKDKSARWMFLQGLASARFPLRKQSSFHGKIIHVLSQPLLVFVFVVEGTALGEGILLFPTTPTPGVVLLLLFHFLLLFCCVSFLPSSLRHNKGENVN